MRVDGDSQFTTQPFWAIFGVLAGTLVAIAVLPSETYVLLSNLVWPSIVLSVGLLCGVVAASWNNPSSLFRAEHILMFGLFYWLLTELVQGTGGRWATTEGVQATFIAIAIFAGALWLGSALASHIEVTTSHAPKMLPDSNFIFWAAIVSGLLGILRPLFGCSGELSCIVDSFFVSRFEAAWESNQFGNFDTILLNLSYFGFITVPLLVAFHHLEGRFSGRAFLLALLALFFLLLEIRGGGRRGVGTIILSGALVWILLQRNISFRHLITLGALGGGLLVLLEFMLFARQMGIGNALDYGFSFLNRTGSVAVDQNFFYVAQMVDIVPSQYPHTGINGVLYHLEVMIPGSILPGKIVNHGFNLPAALGLIRGPGYSWTCSAVGDFYLIGGYKAVAIGGLVWGAMANFCSRLLVSDSSVYTRIMYALVAMALFVSLRAVHELLSTGLAVLAWWGLLRLWNIQTARLRDIERDRLRFLNDPSITPWRTVRKESGDQ